MLDESVCLPVSATNYSLRKNFLLKQKRSKTRKLYIILYGWLPIFSHFLNVVYKSFMKSMKGGNIILTRWKPKGIMLEWKVWLKKCLSTSSKKLPGMISSASSDNLIRQYLEYGQQLFILFNQIKICNGLWLFIK